MAKTPSELIRANIRALSAYHVPPATGMIKLDAMENPYRWPVPMQDQWLALLREVELNRYPDPHATQLTQALRQAMAVPAGSEIVLGNGSDELIQMILMALADSDRVVLAPTPSFVMYQMIAACVNLRFVGVPLRPDFNLDAEAMLAAIAQHQPAVIFLAYPNNPTGNLWDRRTILAILEVAPGLVVLDEAYHAFAEASFMPELARFPHLLVMRTLSKMGLAGLRLGLLAGGAQWLHELDKLRLPYNINVLTQVSARFALSQQQLLRQQTEQICRDRDALLVELRAFKGLQVFPSKANFILFRCPAGQAQGIFEGLKAQRILIKNLSAAGSLLQDCLRVTVGSPAENAALLSGLRLQLG
ncbi:MAG: histidinol-phosphate transaminase [Gammaproteobacteria bacterium]|nr:histidinol-phosphate transaminase [Gammaproteobacteria bacterium]